MPSNEIPLALSIETATRAGSLALMRGTQILDSSVGTEHETQSNILLQQLDSLLKKNGCTLHDIKLLIAALGPGSFTGLRIGLATVKSLAATLEIPCVGIPTLSAIAFASGTSERTIAMLPAGRGEVFAQLFTVESRDQVTAIGEPVHLSPQTLLEKMKAEKSLMWVGIGGQLSETMLEAYAAQQGINWRTGSVEDYPSGHEQKENWLRAGNNQKKCWMLAEPVGNLAQCVGILGWHEWQRGEQIGKMEELQAIYVRPSDAELNQHV
jgi:tRNA threonylcarbamoyladenosine biosynthesis protein TsaB